MTTLYHATPVRNLRSILRRGLLTCKSTGKLKAVWAVPKGGIPWACMHVAWKHRTPITEVVVIQFEVPRGWVRKAQKGLFWIPADVLPDRFGTLSTFSLVAKKGGCGV